MACEETNIVSIIGDPRSPTGYKQISLMDVKERYNEDMPIHIAKIKDRMIMTFSAGIESGAYSHINVAFTTIDQALTFLRALTHFAITKGKEPTYSFDRSLSQKNLMALNGTIPSQIIFDVIASLKYKEIRPKPIVEDADEKTIPNYSPFYLSNHNTFNIIEEHKRLIPQ